MHAKLFIAWYILKKMPEDGETEKEVINRINRIYEKSLKNYEVYEDGQRK